MPQRCWSRVIRAVKSARSSEADLTGDAVLGLVKDNTGLTRRAMGAWPTPGQFEFLT